MFAVPVISEICCLEALHLQTVRHRSCLLRRRYASKWVLPFDARTIIPSVFLRKLLFWLRPCRKYIDSRNWLFPQIPGRSDYMQCILADANRREICTD